MDCYGKAFRSTRCRLLWAALLLAALGCNQSSSPSATTSESQTDGDALKRGEEIAEKMLATYRAARSYTDHATYVQHSVYRGEGIERELPFFHMSIAFVRPNRLRLSFQEAIEGSSGRKGFDIASDGAVMRCSSGELAGQIQESTAPAELTPENILPDPLLREVFANRRLGDVFPQLAMLLNKDDQTLVFPEDEAPRLLDEKTLRGRKCYRVASTSPKGQRVFWIDSETYALHRMELPIEADRAALDAENQFSQLAVWIDFEDATFNAQIAETSFAMDVPEGVRRVRRFVAPPPPAPPEELGKQVAEFEFKSVDGEAVSRESLVGKTVLLDFWQVDCAPCKAHTPELDTIYRELKGDDKFAFYAVNIEGPRVESEVAERTLRGWGGSMPVLVDPKQDAIKKLSVKGTPTLMLLDGKGRLQYFYIRHLQDAASLTEAIRKVLDGGDLAAEARAEHRQLVADYEAELEAATIKDETLEVELPQAAVADRKLPESMGAEELWRAKPEDVARPGNILVFAGDDASARRIITLDGAKAVVELDDEGALVVRHDIPGNSEAGGVTSSGLLRSLDDADGKRWVAVSGVGWQQAHVFDPAWKHVLAFPKDRHPGIADVQLVRGGEERNPRLCVGYWGGVGVQGVSLEGKRVWADRTLDQVVQIAVVPKSGDDDADDFELWCTSSRGTILVLDKQGRPQREVRIGLRSLMQFAVADVDSKLGCCGLAIEAVGKYRVVGFSPDGQVAWHYKLPEGEYVHQVDRIQHVTLPGGKPAWMIATANGTIVWLDHAGRLVDQFAYGQPLTGLSLTNRGDFDILLVSSPESLTAWKLTGK